MLVLSRKKNESVRVGEDVFVTVVEVRGDKVRLGFTAPKEIPVMRTELLIGELADRRYNVLTWDMDMEEFTKQNGMRNPSQNVDIFGLRRALRELRTDFGYDCDRVRGDDGRYYSDSSVLVERIDEVVVNAKGNSHDPVVEGA